MKRSTIKRTKAPRPRVRRPERNPQREAWKTPRGGICAACTTYSPFLHGHHVVARQVVARLNGNEWDPANRLDLCPRCHLNSEFGQENRKLSRMLIPPAAVRFAVDLMGEDIAMAYFMRRYRAVDGES